MTTSPHCFQFNVGTKQRYFRGLNISGNNSTLVLRLSKYPLFKAEEATDIYIFLKEDDLKWRHAARFVRYCSHFVRTYRTVLDACVRQWGQIITRNLRGETDKYAGVGGSAQLDLINITISSNRVTGYVYIYIHIPLKYVLTTICICIHFPPAP